MKSSRMGLVKNMGELEIKSDDARNVINMVSNKVREIVTKVFTENPEWLTKNEAELEEICQPSRNCKLIRHYFWREYYRAQDKGCRMMMSKIYDPVFVADSGFYMFLDDPKQVAWMMCKPEEEFMHMEIQNHEQRLKFQAISRLPLVEPDGKTVRKNEFNAAVTVYKIYADRLHGAVIQRVEKKIQNIPSPDNISGSKDDIEKKIRELEAVQIDVKKVGKDE